MDQKEERGILALGHTLLSYSGKEDVFSIPAEVNNTAILRVGDGALYGNNCVRSLRIPKGIRQIGTRAFFGCQLLKIIYLEGELPDFGPESLKYCPNLQKIVMKDLPVSDELYQQMLGNSVVLEDGQRIAERFPTIRKLDQLSQSLDVQRAAYLPKEINALFHGLPGKDAPEPSRNEKESFLQLIRSRSQPRLDTESEQANDLEARRARLSSPGKVCLFGFEERVPPANNGMRRLNAFLLLDVFYYQGAVAIQWDGNTYYLYQRRYLHNMASMKYLRRDHGIFAEDGQVKDARLAEEIYAKYQLLSIL